MTDLDNLINERRTLRRNAWNLYHANPTYNQLLSMTKKLEKLDAQIAELSGDYKIDGWQEVWSERMEDIKFSYMKLASLYPIKYSYKKSEWKQRQGWQGTLEDRHDKITINNEVHDIHCRIGTHPHNPKGYWADIEIKLRNEVKGKTSYDAKGNSLDRIYTTSSFILMQRGKHRNEDFIFYASKEEAIATIDNAIEKYLAKRSEAKPCEQKKIYFIDLAKIYLNKKATQRPLEAVA